MYSDTDGKGTSWYRAGGQCQNGDYKYLHGAAVSIFEGEIIWKENSDKKRSERCFHKPRKLGFISR